MPTIMGNKARISDQLVAAKLPNSQNTIVGNLSYGSATYFIMPNPAEKMAEIAIPDRISTSMDLLLLLINLLTKKVKQQLTQI